jgi:hypothetical protein
VKAACPSCGSEVLVLNLNIKWVGDGPLRHESAAVCYPCGPLHLWRHAAIGDDSVPWKVEPANCECPRPGSDPLDGI